MGNAFTGVASDVSALHHNPAGLATLSHRELSFMYLSGFEDQKLEHIAAATPVPFQGIVQQGFATIGASLLFAQHGTIEYNRTKPDGSLLSSQSLNAGGDLVGTFGYAERIGVFEFRGRRGRDEYTVEHFAGLSAKLIRSTLAERYSASAVAADVGYLVRVPEAKTSAGVVVQNIGSGMKFIDVSDPLPLTIHAGAAVRPKLPDSIALPAQQDLLVSVDGDYIAQEKLWHVDFGLEYTAYRRFALRLGYRFRRAVVGLTVGFGARWRRFGLDYAWGMTEALSDTHRISLTYRFGAVSRRNRERRRRPFIQSMPDREDLSDIEERKPEFLSPPRRPRREPKPRGRPAPGWIY